jgi:membrane protein YqaA with SNARE-associated domain
MGILFLSAFLAATLFPAGSEIILTMLHKSGDYNVILLLSVATFGNVLGSLVNYVIGYYILKLKNKKFIPIKDKDIKKYSKIYQKWGIYSLLFSWLPIVGDPLTVIAGIFRTNILLFISFVTIGKLARYIIILIMVEI